MEGQDISMRSRPFYRLLLFSAFVGALAALLTVAFFFVYTVGIKAIWEFLPQQLGLPHGTSSAPFVIAICILGGLLVGLMTKYTRTEPKLLAEEFQELTDTGRLKPRSGFVTMIRGLVGLLFGGSIGPEGPMTGGSGALGTWLAERRKMKGPVVAVSTLSGISGMFGSFLSSPYGFAMLVIEGGLESGKLSWKLIFNGILAATIGYGVFFIMTGYQFGGFYEFPAYRGFLMVDLLYAVLLGLVGGLFGLLFIAIFRSIKRATRPWESHPVGLAALAGLVLGLVGAIFPLILFSGETEVQSLIDGAAGLGIFMLIVLALGKLLVTATCLSLGWSGGYIFPSFFMGVGLGLAIHLLLPFIPEVVCMVCVMGGISTALLKSPIAMALIIQALFDIDLAPLIAVSVLVSYILTYGVTLVPENVRKRAEV